MMRHKILSALVAIVASVPTAGMADAAHEASALAWMDQNPSTLAIRILPNDETLVVSLDRESDADVKCGSLSGPFVAYVIDGSNRTIRVGCWRMTAPGMQVNWPNGEVSEIDMADVIVNPALD